MWQTLEAYFNEEDLETAQMFLTAAEITDAGGGSRRSCNDTGGTKVVFHELSLFYL